MITIIGVIAFYFAVTFLVLTVLFTDFDNRDE